MNKTFDLIIAGGSIGGVLAARAALSTGKRVLLTEETAWIGGQLTNQGVPSDEHIWIESFGCTATYRNYRNKVRDYYRNHPFIKDAVKSKEIFNPGSGWVSAIAHEPRLALHLFHEMLLPYITNEHLVLMTDSVVIDVVTESNKVTSATILNLKTSEEIIVEGTYFLDATDTGELLPLSGADYVTGSEGTLYNEPHATAKQMPNDMQPITWVAAVSYHEGETHEMEKPEEYDYFKSLKTPYGSDLLSWYGPTLDPSSTKRLYKFGGTFKDGDKVPPLFTYRQIVDKNLFNPSYNVSDVTLINWPQNDYVFGNIFNTDNDDHHKYMAKQLTLSLVYWLKTEALRDDGGIGYPELKLRGDILGTDDGLALAPYIRESRRMKTHYIVKEQDISAKTNKTLPKFWDSVGVGCYHIDLHMTTESQSYFFENTWPFEIPLGAFISTNLENLIPACKNIGTTHITNGCFRLHPVEWNIGEVAGYLASYCIDHDLTPSTLYADKNHVKAFQNYLDQKGIERAWPKDKVHAI
jgi:hypothetical protein